MIIERRRRSTGSGLRRATRWAMQPPQRCFNQWFGGQKGDVSNSDFCLILSCTIFVWKTCMILVLPFIFFEFLSASYVIYELWCLFLCSQPGSPSSEQALEVVPGGLFLTVFAKWMIRPLIKHQTIDSLIKPLIVWFNHIVWLEHIVSWYNHAVIDQPLNHWFTIQETIDSLLGADFLEIASSPVVCSMTGPELRCLMHETPRPVRQSFFGAFGWFKTNQLEILGQFLLSSSW